MDIFRAIGIALCGAFLSIIVRQYKPEFSILIALITGVILFGMTALGIGEVIDEIKNIVSMTNVDNKYYLIVIKIIGISYLIELICEICRDMGENAIALKLEAVGKIFIMLLTIPILRNFLEVCINAISLL